MFHKHLDQTTKRYKQHPNVAAMYISLPKDKAKRPEHAPLNQTHLPKIRDFAYEPEPTTDSFIATFTDYGFRSPHRRVHNGDLLSQAGVLGYEIRTPVQDHPPADLDKAPHPGFHERERQRRPSSEETAVDSVSSDLSGTTRTPSIATPEESPEEVGSKNRRCGGFRDNPLIVAVAVCMLEHMNR